MAITTDLTTDIGQVRLELGDTTEPALLTDDEVTYFLTAGGSVRAAVGRAMDALARRFARLYDVTIDGQSFSRGQTATALRELVAAQGGTTVETVYVTKIDGYSDDVAASDTRATSAGEDDFDVPWR